LGHILPDLAQKI